MPKTRELYLYDECLRVVVDREGVIWIAEEFGTATEKWHDVMSDVLNSERLKSQIKTEWEKIDDWDYRKEDEPEYSPVYY